MKLRPLFLLAALAPAAANTAEPVVPVHEEPRHRLVYEKGDIRVFSTNIPAGDRSLYHRHQDPTLYVLLSASLVRNQDLGSEWVGPDPDLSPPVGAFLFRDYAAQPQEHRVENTGDRSFQVIGVIHSGAGIREETKGAPTPELQNPWFAGYRVRLAAGAKSGVHRHRGPVLVVQVSAGASRVLMEGCAAEEKTVAGTWSMHEPGADHVLENSGTGPVELVEIEIRR